MPLNPQEQAVAQLNSVNSLVTEIQQFVNNVLALQEFADPTAIWQQLPTCALNPDGSLGAPDANPVQTNPINTNLVDGLTRACSYSQYASVKAILIDFAEIINTGPNNATMQPFLGD